MTDLQQAFERHLVRSRFFATQDKVVVALIFNHFPSKSFIYTLIIVSIIFKVNQKPPKSFTILTVHFCSIFPLFMFYLLYLFLSITSYYLFLHLLLIHVLVSSTLVLRYSIIKESICHNPEYSCNHTFHSNRSECTFFDHKIACWKIRNKCKWYYPG